MEIRVHESHPSGANVFQRPITEQNSISRLFLLHDGYQLCFKTPTFQRSLREDSDFSQINGYWANCLTDAQRDKLWKTYSKIHNTLDSFGESWSEANDVESLTAILTQQIKELYENIDMDRLRQWSVMHGGVRAPSVFEAEFIERPDKAYTREKTYLKSEYIDLAVLTVALKMVLPIWGYYISRIEKQMGNFKEYLAYQMLSESKLFNVPALKKLGEFTDARVKRDDGMKAAVYGGISSEDFTDHLTAYVVVRKLSVANATFMDQDKHLVTSVHMHIDHWLKDSVATHVGSLKDKKVSEDNENSAVTNTSEEKSLSVLEQYKTPEEVNRADIGIIDAANSDPYRQASRIAPGIPRELVEEFAVRGNLFKGQTLAPVQLVLMGMVLSNDVTPEAMLLEEAAEVEKAVAVAAAIMWHLNHKFIAALLMSIPVNQSSGTIMNLTGVTKLDRFTKATLAKLDELFPFEEPSNRAVKTNTGVNCIGEIVDGITQYRWKTLLSNELLNQDVTFRTTDRYLSIPEDLREVIASMAFEIIDMTANMRKVVID